MLSNEIITNNYLDEKTILQDITIFGIQNEPKTVLVNRVVHNNYFYNTTEKVSIPLTYVFKQIVIIIVIFPINKINYFNFI